MEGWKYCSYCGKEILKEAVICPHCGCPVAASCTQELDIPSTGLNILSFLLPIVGLILYIVFNEKSPNKAKALGKWALIGFCIGLVCNVILIAL